MNTFMQSLVLMGEGMGGIMAVILIIMALVFLLKKVNTMIDDKRSAKPDKTPKT